MPTLRRNPSEFMDENYPQNYRDVSSNRQFSSGPANRLLALELKPNQIGHYVLNSNWPLNRISHIYPWHVPGWSDTNRQSRFLFHLLSRPTAHVLHYESCVLCTVKPRYIELQGTAAIYSIYPNFTIPDVQVLEKLIAPMWACRAWQCSMVKAFMASAVETGRRPQLSSASLSPRPAVCCVLAVTRHVVHCLADIRYQPCRSHRRYSSTDDTIIEIDIEIAILTEIRMESKSIFLCIPSNDLSTVALDSL